MTNNSMGNRTLKKAALLGAALFLMIPCFSSQTNPDSGEQTASVQPTLSITKAQKINPNTIEIVFSDNQRMTLDFYGENIFRLFQDKNGGILRNPQA